MNKLFGLGAMPKKTATAITPEMVVHSLIADATAKAANKASKKLKNYATAQEFYQMVYTKKLNVFVEGEDDRASFDALQFHLKCVQFIELEHGWSVANYYYTHVMQGWREEWIDLVYLSEQPAALVGAMRAAVHHDTLSDARSTALEARLKGGGGGGGGGGGDTGMDI